MAFSKFVGLQPTELLRASRQRSGIGNGKILQDFAYGRGNEAPQRVIRRRGVNVEMGTSSYSYRITETVVRPV
jgi:hypothetical protein